MLNQPINVIPSVLSGVGEGVVDATLPLNVSWQVSGDTPMIAYRIVIQQNDTSSTQVFSTGKVTLQDPFYGKDARGNIQIFTASEISASQLYSAGIINGYENGYKITITQWWGLTDDESITQTSPSYFITRKYPSLSINLPSYDSTNPYTSKDITINALFSQEQGDTVKIARWRLYEGGMNAPEENILYDSGDMDTQILQFTYDGLLPYTYYLCTINVQTSSGINLSAQATFYVKYNISSDVGEVNVFAPAGEDYIQVSWSARSSIDGTESGDVSYSDGGIDILEQSSITYSPLSISAPWSVVWRGKANTESNSVDILELHGASSAAFMYMDSSSVSFYLNGNIIFSKAISGHTLDTYTIIITPTHYYIRQDTFTGGTIPSNTLYPSTTLYPSEATEVVNQYDGEITYTQFDITSIILNGEQHCDYFWIESGELSEEQINQIIGDDYYQPSIDYNTMFLSNFDSQTTTAYISGTGGNGIGASVYRSMNGSQKIEHIVDVYNNIPVIRDYGAKARNGYQYYVYLIGEDSYLAVFMSDSVSPKYGDYTLMECIYNESDGAYHVQAAYPFACNVTHSSISNNNTPNIFRNFTRYPNRQPVSSLYSSGTLSALIGTVNQTGTPYQYNPTYKDSWELAESIISLSTSQNPKFLRDMKGNIWRVETSEAIATEVSNKNIFMPIKITIPWVEVGSTDGVSIVAIPSDPVFQINEIGDTSIYIDVPTGNLIWQNTESYNGTVLSMNGSSLVATTPNNTYQTRLEINKESYLISNT